MILSHKFLDLSLNKSTQNSKKTKQSNNDIVASSSLSSSQHRNVKYAIMMVAFCIFAPSDSFAFVQNAYSYTSTSTTSQYYKRNVSMSLDKKSNVNFSFLGTTSKSNSLSRRTKFQQSLVRNMKRNRPDNTITTLNLSKNNNNNNDDDENKESNNFLESVKEKILPSPLRKKVEDLLKVLILKWTSFFPTFKIAIISLFTGAIIASTAILVPVYNSVDQMTEPVTLFETILTDLERGYVDDVDTNKLFETGVNAMLRSLDPYTEFEGRQEAQDLNESVSGRYGGVGLIISGAIPKENGSSVIRSLEKNKDGSSSSPSSPSKKTGDDARRLMKNENHSLLNDEEDDDLLDFDMGASNDDEDLSLDEKIALKKSMKKELQKGIRVVSAMEGYAFDYGMRVGDKLVALDGERITPGTNVEDVRNKLRGEPGTEVAVTFQRDGLPDEITVSLPRQIVTLRDVKCATMIGKPENGIGYIQVAGFSAHTGAEVRNAIYNLQQAAEESDAQKLQGLVLDLRGNPGGLLTSAVDVASLLVPKNSEIVSAKGRGFPGLIYKSRVDPILDRSTKLAVLINGQTASAAEIVAGAIQDLDVGVIVGSDRSFGKGLVQNVSDLPFDTALKFTVAKYYTPSGRCIQSTNYKEGGGSSSKDGKYIATKVSDKDKSVFYTQNGREVKDGGGISADYKVEAPQASALEVTLLRSSVMGDFAAEWSKNHAISHDFQVTDDLYKQFQAFVKQRQTDGEINLNAIYKGPIDELKRSLKQSGYNASSKELAQLESKILHDMERDFEKYKKDIKEDIGTNILARYLPESMLIERSVKSDKQVIAAAKLLTDDTRFNTLLARSTPPSSSSSINTASNEDSKVRINFSW